MERKEILGNMEKSFIQLGDLMEDLPWEDKGFYTTWLAQTYFYVAKTTPLIALACAKTPTTRSKLHYRFIEELTEERGHELLLLRDLKNFDMDISEFTELPPTAMFYQSLHYMISEQSPATIISFSLTLEGLASKRLHNICDRVEKAHGKNAVGFLKLHCEVDQKHFEQAMPVLEMATDEELPMINSGIKLCRYIYSELLRATYMTSRKEDIAMWNLSKPLSISESNQKPTLN